MNNPHQAVSANQVAVATALVALVLFLSLAFQTAQVMRDRDTLHQLSTQQDKPLEDSRKIQTQLSALALGTKKLADGGDKNAITIINRMQDMGISVGAPTPAAADAPAPAAQP